MVPKSRPDLTALALEAEASASLTTVQILATSSSSDITGLCGSPLRLNRRALY